MDGIQFQQMGEEPQQRLLVVSAPQMNFIIPELDSTISVRFVG